MLKWQWVVNYTLPIHSGVFARFPRFTVTGLSGGWWLTPIVSGREKSPSVVLGWASYPALFCRDRGFPFGGCASLSSGSGTDGVAFGSETSLARQYEA
jgi:hypothetical protein